MPAKRYRVFLNGKKRSYLKQLVSTGTSKARRINRARILLLSDERPCQLIGDVVIPFLTCFELNSMVSFPLEEW